MSIGTMQEPSRNHGQWLLQPLEITSLLESMETELSYGHNTKLKNRCRYHSIFHCFAPGLPATADLWYFQFHLRNCTRVVPWIWFGGGWCGPWTPVLMGWIQLLELVVGHWGLLMLPGLEVQSRRNITNLHWLRFVVTGSSTTFVGGQRPNGFLQKCASSVRLQTKALKSFSTTTTVKTANGPPRSLGWMSLCQDDSRMHSFVASHEVNNIYLFWLWTLNPRYLYDVFRFVRTCHFTKTFETNIRSTSSVSRFPSWMYQMVLNAHMQPGVILHMQCCIHDTWWDVTINIFPFCVELPCAARWIGRPWCWCRPRSIGPGWGMECQLRLLLCEDLQYFGAGSFGDQLDVAYKDFVAYCKVQKIKHSQPPFLPKMVLWLDQFSLPRLPETVLVFWITKLFARMAWGGF